MHLLAFFLMVKQHVSVTQMLRFDLCLCPAEGVAHAFQVAFAVLAAFAQSFCLLWAETSDQDLVVQRHVLTHRTRITLATAASNELTVDSSRVMNFRADACDVSIGRYLNAYAQYIPNAVDLIDFLERRQI